jgi:hypothetical protein
MGVFMKLWSCLNFEVLLKEGIVLSNVRLLSPLSFVYG